MKNKIKLYEISNILSLKSIGKNLEFEILNLCNSSSQYNNILSFVNSIDFIEHVKGNRSIKGLFIKPEMLDNYLNIKSELSFILSKYPEYDFYKLHHFLVKETDFYEKYDFKLTIGKNCVIDKTAVLEDGVIIGNNVTIAPLAVVRKGSIIGNDVSIGCNTVIGSEGFQLIRHVNKNFKVQHVGGTLLKDGVEVGDNCAICNSLFEGYTIIGENTKINNLVHIAHNCQIGNNIVIGGGVVFCGSCIVEDNVWIAPNSTLLNKVRIGKNSIIGMASKVLKSIPSNTKFFNKTENVFNEI